VRTGEAPRHPAGEEPPDDAVVQLNDSGKVPVVAGYAGIPDTGGRTVVGEFDPGFLITLVTRPGLGRVHLVDDRQRLIAADRSKGFQAFSPLPDRRLDNLALTAARVGEPSSLLYRGDDAAVAAAAPFSGGGAAGKLGWQVVSVRPASWLTLPEYVAQRRTTLAGLLGSAAGAACLGWLYIVVVRPLGTLAGRAEALAAGERRTVLFPQHHDEVGAVVRNLELVRQQLQEGPRKRDARPDAPLADERR
jgi:HAMP domain-containing protein